MMVLDEWFVGWGYHGGIVIRSGTVLGVRISKCLGLVADG